MNQHVKSWQCEDLCAALMKAEGASHVEKASPRRKRITKDGNTEDKPAVDFWRTFDVLAIFPEQLRSAQVYSGRSEGTLSDKQVHVASMGPWPDWLNEEVWHWKQRELRFDVYMMEDMWRKAFEIPVPEPKVVLDRADVTLG